MKKITSFLILLITLNSFSQEIIELKTTGFGGNESMAETDALRKAIEEAFGAFISSDTEIFNDELIKDEIVTVSNGNIIGFNLISKGKSDSETFFGTYKVKVSLTKLTEYAQSKGVSVEVSGGLFAADMKLKKLYKSNEEKSIRSALFVFDSYIKKGFDFNLVVESPTLNPNKKTDEEEYQNNLIVEVSLNKNFIQGVNYINSVFESLTLNELEVQDYYNKNVPLFPVILTLKKQGKRKITDITKTYYLRSEKSLKDFFKVSARIAAYPFMAIIKKSYNNGEIAEIRPNEIFNQTVTRYGSIDYYGFKFIPCLNGSRFPEGCRLPYTNNGNLPHNYFSRNDGYGTSSGSKSTEKRTNRDFILFIKDLEDLNWTLEDQLEMVNQNFHPIESFEYGFSQKNQFYFNFDSPISVPLIRYKYVNFESINSMKILNNISIQSFNDSEYVPLTNFDKEKNPTEKPESSYLQELERFKPDSLKTLPFPEGMTAETVINKYITAIGGKKKVMKVKTTVTIAIANKNIPTGNLYEPVQEIQLEMTRKAATPNKFSTEMSIKGGGDL
ncbi:hypothetical protein N9E80_00655 [Flavobacteriaceae bacterium]|nr:hypothetical protein [Flavobacteriaceae bacterium]